MGLTRTSTGIRLLKKEKTNKIEGYKIALAGNPNVGKSTIFNNITGMHQHTGNWTGKTVSNAKGECIYKNTKMTFIDIPGTYSIMSNSEEEEIARDYIIFGKPNVTIIVVDATCLERNLNLVFQIMEITDNVVLCVNLLDEAKKKNIQINLKKLQEKLNIPVVGTIARKKQTLNNLLDIVKKICEGKITIKPNKIIYEKEIEEKVKEISPKIKKRYDLNENLYRWISLKIIDGDEKILKTIEKKLNIDIKSLKYEKENKEIKDKIIYNIMKKAEEICKEICEYKDENHTKKDRKIDKILTSKILGIPIMILFLGIIFWLTIVGANYPSQILLNFFRNLQEKLIEFMNIINVPQWLSDMLILGGYQTLTWVVSVMLPPMAIFFPLFTILEDLGYLPRIAFNMDGFFKKACCSGKQMITMCMGFGCNSCGVTGCRIIDSPRERLIAILTNNLVPCNGRFPFLITISTIFIAGTISGLGASILSTLSVILVIILGIFMTLIISKILSKTILKGMPSSLTLELPPYRKPQFGKILIRSLFDRTLFVLGRAMAVALPAGFVIWIFANVGINGESSLLTMVANFLEPFARIMGLDGYILTAFILGIPANEIVLPIMLMCYLHGTSLVDMEEIQMIGEILRQNGWTILTAINVMIFTIFHFPCATTLLTIKKETGKLKWVILSFIIPTVCGIVLCIFTTIIYNLIFV